MKAVASKQSFESLSQISEVLKFNRRFNAEIILPNGERRYFRSKSCSKKEAEKQILAYVASIENYLNRPVFWRYAGDKVYRMGQHDAPKGTLRKKIKRAFVRLFELED
ncbi:DUF6018 family natural product bioysynthesis protein [Sutcliffiella cohnii]|uniref:DUF6018 family natural product bioysynthesis protein n=1 Tax=Sutcliffiella cohnii TaxID=33932 RepID=UPI00082D65FA|nr:DUF6018 family natural product bioysynthesis protein [Sutcliffiella cohnii]